MRILVITNEQNDIIAAIENVVINEIDQVTLQQAINEHYDHVDAVIKSISNPNMMEEISILMGIKDGDETTYTETLTLKPSYLYQPAVTAAPPVNGIDYKLLDRQRAHLGDIIVNAGKYPISEEQLTALDGIQALLDHIPDVHIEDHELTRLEISHREFARDLANYIFDSDYHQLYEIEQTCNMPDHFALSFTLCIGVVSRDHLYNYPNKEDIIQDILLAGKLYGLTFHNIGDDI